MAFLDNSGDIILDAVLTDTGRMRLAKGDGSFNITKFALGDDEINYALYDKNHVSGSAYYDIEILQTPCLEAFTNNTSTMKSKLLSISRTNLLYLPVIRRNTAQGIADNSSNNILSLMVDQSTSEDVNLLAATGSVGINGYQLNYSSNSIVFDQGIESNALGSGDTQTLDADLVETQYIVEMDNRFGYLADGQGGQATPSFIDDDNIASYYLSTTTNTEYFGDSGTNMSGDVISGPRGTRIQFLVGPSSDLASSTYLFTQLGSTSTLNGVSVYQIDTTVRITGATTGFKLDIPLRFVKKQ
jgi:hypothetical protein